MVKYKESTLNEFMPTISINGVEYNSDDLSEEVKENLVSMQFVQGELTRLSAEIAVYKTAEVAYARAIENGLETKE